ncbi:MAG: type II secretion system protein, partial [Armatimonadota bacterium]
MSLKVGCLRKRAFTLIELLTVIAIIAVLAGILFPVFAQAREKARQVTCLSNTRNFGTAFQQYVQDYDEAFPPRVPFMGDEGTTAIYDQFGFSGAGLQARLARNHPECRGWVLERREQGVQGPASVNLALPEETRLVAVVGVSFPAGEGSEPSCLPLALEPVSKVAVPAGRWRVMTFFARPSGFDYLNPASARRLLDAVHGEFERRLGEH